jgi:hypothetical protein
MMAINQGIRRSSYLLVLALVFTSCAKIKINTPSSRFISPEANGNLFDGSARLSGSSATEGTLNFDNDKTDNPLELRNNVTGLGLDLDLGIVEKLDFIIKGSASAPGVYTIKYQILGDPRSTAQIGNQSLAVTVGYGTQLESQSENDSGIFDDSSDNTSADIEQSLMEFSVIYGIRPQSLKKEGLFYGSIQASKHDINFEITKSDNIALDGKTFSLNSWSYGASLGAIRYFDKYYANIEMSAQRTDWTNNDPMTYAFLSMAMGYKWD